MKGSVQKQLLKLFKNGEKYTMADLEEATGSTRSSISQTIIRLRNKGYDIIQVPVYYLANNSYVTDEQTVENKIREYLNQHGSINREEGLDKLGIENISVYLRNMMQNNSLAIEKKYEYGKTADGKDRMMVRYYLQGWCGCDEETAGRIAEEMAEKDGLYQPENGYEEKIAELEAEINYQKEMVEVWKGLVNANGKKEEAWDKLKKQLQDNKNLAWMLINDSDVNRTLYTVYKWILAIMSEYEGERGENDAETETEKQEV